MSTKPSHAPRVAIDIFSGQVGSHKFQKFPTLNGGDSDEGRFLTGIGASFSSPTCMPKRVKNEVRIRRMEKTVEKEEGIARVKKRKREGDRNDDGEALLLSLLRDPLEVFGSDIMMMILSHLDARSVALSLLVSRAWHGVASSDRLWAPKCEELWKDKVHIPRVSLMRGLSKLAAYSISVMDGKRARITRDDLCDHAWHFHFNKAAPQFWINLDPFWKSTGPLMRRYFHPDGSQTADPDDKVWGGHESCYSVVTGIIGENKIRRHYVRINRWPSMSVKRKADWGWVMSNHLYTYNSIPDAEKEGGTGPYSIHK